MQIIILCLRISWDVIARARLATQLHQPSVPIGFWSIYCYFKSCIALLAGGQDGLWRRGGRCVATDTWWSKHLAIEEWQVKLLQRSTGGTAKLHETSSPWTTSWGTRRAAGKEPDRPLWETSCFVCENQDLQLVVRQSPFKDEEWTTLWIMRTCISKIYTSSIHGNIEQGVFYDLLFVLLLLACFISFWSALRWQMVWPATNIHEGIKGQNFAGRVARHWKACKSTCLFQAAQTRELAPPLVKARAGGRGRGRW